MSESRVAERVQVNAPFRMLVETYLDSFLTHRLNPEIGFDGDTLDRVTPSEVDEVVGKLREQGLTITCHAPFLDLSPGSLDSAVRRLTRKRFEQVLYLLPVLQPKTVVCHSGWDHRRYLELKDIWLEKSLDMWIWFANAVRDQGSRMMLENVYERSPEEFLEIYDPLRETGARVCLDTGHQAAFGQAPLESWIQGVGKDIGELHLHDNRGEWDDHLAPGKGSVDFGLLFKTLPPLLNEPPVITLEPHHEEALWEALAFLEGALPW
jgi:sugar phosphate isomerase/epimerase